MKTAQILKLVLLVAIVFALFRLVQRQRRGRWSAAPQPYTLERFEDEDAEMSEDEEMDEDSEADEDGEMEMYSNAMPTPQWDYGVPLMNVATDLLPKASAAADTFSEFAPKSLLGQNFLDAKKYIGVDTQGSSLRNANYDLRSSPAIARKDVGPWFQSTIDGDLFRKPLE